MDLDRIFSVASDGALVQMIQRARERLVIVAPAVGDAVADITDDQLRGQISSRLRAPAEVLGPFEISIETENGSRDEKVDERWVAHERKRIEDEYTFVVPRYGRVIFHRQKANFSREITRFERNVEKYCAAARKAFGDTKAGFRDRLVAEYLPRWRQKPPSRFAKYGVPSTEENLRSELVHRIDTLVNDALLFQEPIVRVIYKDIARQSVDSVEFRGLLAKAMQRRGVPVPEIESLFSAGDAALTAHGFKPI